MAIDEKRTNLHQRVAAAILEAAAGVLAETGGTASMGDVAGAAGVARATLYRYFPNRRALLEELARSTLDDAAERLDAAGLERVEIREAIARLVRALMAAGQGYVVLLQERPDPEGFEQRIAGPVRALLERAQAEGAVREDVPAAWLTESLMGMVSTVLRSPYPLGAEDTVAAVSSLFMDGARPSQRGRANQ